MLLAAVSETVLNATVVGGILSVTLILAQTVNKLIEKRKNGNGNSKKSSAPPPAGDSCAVCRDKVDDIYGTTASIKAGFDGTSKSVDALVKAVTETNRLLRDWIIGEKARRDALRGTGEHRILDE